MCVRAIQLCKECVNRANFVDFRLSVCRFRSAQSAQMLTAFTIILHMAAKWSNQTRLNQLRINLYCKSIRLGDYPFCCSFHYSSILFVESSKIKIRLYVSHFYIDWSFNEMNKKAMNKCFIVDGFISNGQTSSVKILDLNDWFVRFNRVCFVHKLSWASWFFLLHAKSFTFFFPRAFHQRKSLAIKKKRIDRPTDREKEKEKERERENNGSKRPVSCWNLHAD